MSSSHQSNSTRRHQIQKEDDGWEQPTGPWFIRLPLFAGLFVVLLGFVFAVLGVMGSFLDSHGPGGGLDQSLGAYLQLHGQFIFFMAVFVTLAIFLRLVTRRDKSNLTTPRLLAAVTALGIFDAASLAIARF